MMCLSHHSIASLCTPPRRIPSFPVHENATRLHIDRFNSQSNIRSSNFGKKEKASTWGLASRSQSLRSSRESPPAATSTQPTPPSDGSLHSGLTGHLGVTLSKYPRRLLRRQVWFVPRRPHCCHGGGLASLLSCWLARWSPGVSSSGGR